MASSTRDPSATDADRANGLSDEELRAEQAGDLPDREAMSILDVGALNVGLPTPVDVGGGMPSGADPLDGQPALGVNDPVDTNADIPVNAPVDAPIGTMPVNLPVDTLPVKPPLDPPPDQPIGPMPINLPVETPPVDGDPIGIPELPLDADTLA